MKLIKKAWRLNLQKIEDGYQFSNIYGWGKTKGEAKYDILLKIKFDDLTLEINGDEVKYSNIPVIRSKDHDLYEINGIEETIEHYNKRIEEEKRINDLDNLLTTNPNSFAYLCKRGSYYSDNFCGYSSSRLDAGIYTIKQAVKESKSCNEISIELINTEEHNKRINLEIERLKNKLIE